MMTSLRRTFEKRHEGNKEVRHKIFWKITQAKGTSANKFPEVETFLADWSNTRVLCDRYRMMRNRVARDEIRR